MELSELSERLDDVLNGAPMCYLYNEPPIDDFTKKFSGKLFVETMRGKLILDFNLINRGQQLTAFGMIFRTVFENNRPVFTWNIKQLMSYLRFHYKDKQFHELKNAIDLNYGMSFIGQGLEHRPENLVEAISAAKQFAVDQHWKSASERLFVPLAARVLPAIETRAEHDSRFDLPFYKKYEIEGQSNGRLRCFKPNDSYLNPHTLHGDQLASLRPKEKGNVFVTFDYRSHEVCVLAWLSKDQKLNRLLKEPDLYRAMYEVIFRQPCQEDEQRAKIKSLFLPLIFGLQPHGLAERAGIDIRSAVALASEIQSVFSTAFTWVQEKEAEIDADNVEVCDYFGRRRSFSKVSAYKRRNFEIQGPASRICLEKLVQVHDVFKEKLAFHIHDEFVFESSISELRSFYQEAVNLLEADLDLCPGLRLQVGCSVGSSLSNLKEIPCRRPLNPNSSPS